MVQTRGKRVAFNCCHCLKIQLVFGISSGMNFCMCFPPHPLPVWVWFLMFLLSSLSRRCSDISLHGEHVSGRSLLPAESDANLSQVIPVHFRQRMSLEQGLKQQKAAKPNY